MSVREHERFREESMERNEAQQQGQTPEAPRPVAYDSEGKPLYAAPPEPQAPATQPQIVHMSRAIEPVEQEISPEIKKRHDESVKAFPNLNLSEHEYIVSAVRRHPAGIWFTVAVTTLAISVIFALVINFPFLADLMGIGLNGFGLVILMGILMTTLFLIGGYAAIWVYMNNRFFLTNESVIQEIQTSLFNHREQTVSLLNIEDASYHQNGPIQSMLNYGSIRLSTEGDETTYRFDYVFDPKHEIAILNNAVEAFKNGRPVDLPVSEEVSTRRNGDDD